jgi:hypothetical protein
VARAARQAEAAAGSSGGAAGSTAAFSDVPEHVGAIANAQQVVEGMRERFTACYQSQLRRNPNAEGTVLLTFLVDCRGRIVTIQAEARGLDRTTVECLLAVGGDRFEAPRGGTAVVQVPIHFVRGAPPDAGPAPEAAPVEPAIEGRPP